MRPSELSTIFFDQEETSSAESYRRIEIFLNALAALPKKSWRPRVNARCIRVEGPGLSRMQRLIEWLDISFQDRSIVHVAGTSGKGSTALMIAESLHAAGRSTAAFFSPHVTSLAERFWIRGGLCGARTAGRAASRIAEAAAAMAREPIGPPSYFESALALLLLAAEEEGCDTVVLEAGLGGTFDATCLVAPAALDVLTSIGIDHTDLLGDTIEQIARDKAGIITPRGRVVSAALPRGARAEVEKTARERSAILHHPPEVAGLVFEGAGIRLDFRFSGGERWKDVRVGMSGAHQAANAAVAAGACRLLGLGEADIRSGLLEARLPCRIERMPGEPLVILDGAHNRDKMRALMGALGAVPADRRFFVLGAVGDKNYEGLAEELAGPVDRFFVTTPPGSAPRSGLSPQKFARALRQFGAVDIREFIDPWRAFEAALSEAGEGDLVVVAGSFFLAGEFRKRWVSEERIVEAGHPFPPEMGR
ncbi:MAG TPA: Mur ligase family protein [Nitrospinota bacterium]|jgi:dihydrofolate synthase/folylpolyglutamate synthase|nr:Mur ligase family protein [Nitrospinota bacterium]